MSLPSFFKQFYLGCLEFFWKCRVRMRTRPREIRVTPLSPQAVRERIAVGCKLLDTREPGAYGTGHIAGSVNIGPSGQFASWAGSLLSPDQNLILLPEDASKVEETVMRLARVGLENVTGYLEGGIPAWKTAGLETATIEQITVDELHSRLGSRLQVIDVRRPDEFEAGRVPSARNVPLNELQQRIGEIDLTRSTAVICAGGYRSSIGGSLLEGHGARNLFNVSGGTNAWVKAGFETER